MTHPLLRWILRLDRSGSAQFIGIALFLAPALQVFEPLRAQPWLVWVPVLVGAVWLAVLGVLMAGGLTWAAARGHDLSEDWWMTMLDSRAVRVTQPSSVCDDRNHERAIERRC